MKINIASLKPGEEQAFSFRQSAEKLNIPLNNGSLMGDVRLEGSVSNLGSSFRLTGKISCSRRFTCDRCLKETEREETYDFNEEYRCLEDGEDFTAFRGDVIDLTDLVGDAVILGQPMISLCREDCRGLCPVCGGDLNEGRCSCEVICA